MEAKTRSTISGFLNNIDVKTMVFSVFLVAGNFKADPRLSWLPIDLTLLFFLLTAAYVIWHFFKNNGRIPLTISWVLLMYVLFAIPLFWTDWNAYSVEKVTRFYSLTLMAAVAPFFLFRENRQLRRLLHCLAGLGLLMGVDAIITLLAGGSVSAFDQSTGVSAFGSNTIALGRAAGMAFIWVAVLALEGRVGLVRTLGLLGTLVVVLFASGSRGPLLAAIGALGPLIVLHYMKQANHVLRLVGMGLLISSVLLYSVTVAPANATNRIEHFFEGNLGTSELKRLDAFELSWEAIKVTPAGTGWGGFATHINLWFGASHQYPHNIFLEVLLEGGWLPGIYLGLLCVIALSRIYRRAGTLEARTLFSLLFFYMINAMVSGDINDNKVMFAFLALSLAYRGERSESAQDCPS